jgi:hypothetical protein
MEAAGGDQYECLKVIYFKKIFGDTTTLELSEELSFMQ